MSAEPTPTTTMARRLDEKPRGPSTLFIQFRCGCGRENTVPEHFADWHDLGDGDGLDFECECGAYYKKTGRIPEEAKIKRWYEAVS